MSSEHRLTTSPGETEAIGAELAATLIPGEVVLISGELGTGKTTFVRGACRGLGITGPVTSPTFTIGRRYTAPDGTQISHLDLYRLEGLDGEDPALLADYLGPGRIAFVEWPEHGGPELGPVRRRVRLAHAGGDRRTIDISEAD
jgi:tRNA threonylcarbamoyladenosine biosynthesis protein TsaE